MRLHAVIAITAIVAVPINANRAFAQFNYSSQNRSISVLASAVVQATPINDTKSAAAPDFTDFIQSLSASEILTPASAAIANASQTSQLTSTNITASGSVSGQGARFTNITGGVGIGDSIFSVSFTLAAPTDVQIAAHLLAHADRGFSTSSSTSGDSAFSLIGGTTNWSFATIIPDGQKDSSIQIVRALSLASGTYTVATSAHANSGIFLIENNFSGFKANASYSISVNIVPEPSSVTLATIGALGLVSAYFGRIRLAFQRSSLTN
jgi:hypothetical protein